MHATRSTLAPSGLLAFLALLGGLPAQQPTLAVQDLLRSDGLARRSMEQDTVLRPSGQFGFGHTPHGSCHRIEGERDLTSPSPADSGDAEEPRKPRGVYTDTSLAAVLQALSGGELPSFDIRYHDDAVLVETEIPELAAVALAKMRSALPPLIRVGVVLERFADPKTTAADILLSGTLTFPNGDAQVLGDVQRKRILHDFRIEIPQVDLDISTAMRDFGYGSSVTLRARPLPFREEAVLEVVVRTSTPIEDAPIEVRPGPFDQIAVRVDEAAFSFRAGRGATTRHEWSAIDGSRLRLTCTPRWQTAPPGAEKAASLRLECSSLFCVPVLGFRSTNDIGAALPPASTSVRSIVEQGRALAGADAGGLFEPGDRDGGGVLLLMGSGAGRLQRWIETRLDEALAPARVVVEIFDVPAGVATPGESPDASRLVGRLSGPLLASHPVCFASAREQTHIAGWHLHGAERRRIDPVMGIVEDGWFATVQASAGADGRTDWTDLVDVQIRVKALEQIRKLSGANTAMLAQALAGDAPAPAPAPAGGDGDEKQPARLPKDVVSIELPVQASIALDARVPIDAEGRGSARRSARSVFGPGREMLVRVTLSRR